MSDLIDRVGTPFADTGLLDPRIVVNGFVEIHLVGSFHQEIFKVFGRIIANLDSELVLGNWFLLLI
jgi:hypothetical protein